MKYPYQQLIYAHDVYCLFITDDEKDMDGAYERAWLYFMLYFYFFRVLYVPCMANVCVGVASDWGCIFCSTSILWFISLAQDFIQLLNYLVWTLESDLPRSERAENKARVKA